MLKLHYIYIFVFVVYVQLSYSAVINVREMNMYYTINIDQVIFESLYQCLADDISNSCILHLKIEYGDRFGGSQVTQQNDTAILMPHFTCAFNSIDIDDDYYKCARFSLNITQQMTDQCSQYDFIITWEYSEEYFTDNSLVNCSINSTTFAYRYKYLPTEKTNTTSTTTNSETGTTFECDDILLPVVISTSSLLSISIIVILFLSINLHRRRTDAKTNIYSFPNIRERDSHTYESTQESNGEQVLTNVYDYEDNYLHYCSHLKL